MKKYGKLKIGDSFPCDLLNKWSELGNHKYYIDSSWSEGNKWIGGPSHFYGFPEPNRTIEAFKKLDGRVGFLVSDTEKCYLCAEGFEEFVNNQKFNNEQ